MYRYIFNLGDPVESPCQALAGKPTGSRINSSCDLFWPLSLSLGCTFKQKDKVKKQDYLKFIFLNAVTDYCRISIFYYNKVSRGQPLSLFIEDVEDGALINILFAAVGLKTPARNDQNALSGQFLHPIIFSLDVESQVEYIVQLIRVHFGFLLKKRLEYP